MAWSAIAVAWDAWRCMRGGPTRVARRQRQRLAALVAYARRHSRYYAHLYRDIPADAIDPHSLPPVTKADLMANFDAWVSDPAVTYAAVAAFIADPAQAGAPFLGRYGVWSTSGTTGIPAILLQDRRALSVYTPLSVMRGYLGGMRPGALLRVLWQIMRRGGRVGTLLVAGGHSAGAVMVARRQRLSPRAMRRIRLFSVLAPPAQLVAEVQSFQPAVLSGYASALTLLAEAQAAGHLQIRPALVVSTAEQLTPAAQAGIAAAFGCPVHNAYGCSEAGGIAFECSRGRLHVNSDWVIVEPVDERYQPVPPGQISHTVLVTNLANHIQPIIRYDLGDQVVIEPLPCPCGSPLPAIRVVGRTDETLIFAAPDGRRIPLLPLALTTLVERIPGVGQFQLIQTGPAWLEVRLACPSAGCEDQVWAAVADQLRAHLAAAGLGGVEIRRSVEQPGRDPRSGKYRHIWAEHAALQSKPPAMSETSLRAPGSTSGHAA